MKFEFGKLLLVAALLCAFVLLGLWQLQRAQEKQRIKDSFISQSALPVVQLDGEVDLPEEMKFRTATARGRYETEFEVLLDNKIEQGKAGYHVLTPLRIAGTDTLLLVNRGWAPWTFDRQRTHNEEPPFDSVTVRGRLSLPAVAPISFEQEAELKRFTPVWQNFDLARFRSLVDAPVVNFVMELDSTDDSALVRNWPVYDDNWIERHRGYAFQWFSMAAVLLIASIVFALRRR